MWSNNKNSCRLDLSDDFSVEWEDKSVKDWEWNNTTYALVLLYI